MDRFILLTGATVGFVLGVVYESAVHAFEQGTAFLRQFDKDGLAEAKAKEFANKLAEKVQLPAKVQ